MRSRRTFLKKALYAAPLVLTVSVRPGFARGAYGGPGNGPGGGSGGGNPDPGRNAVRPGKGNKDAHDWWMFWRRL